MAQLIQTEPLKRLDAAIVSWWRAWIEPLIPVALYGLIAIATFITYSRIPPGEMYHVSRSGVAGGASRTLVFLNFSTAFVAIALLGVVVPLLLQPRAGLGPISRRRVNGLAFAAFLLCLTVALPGVVDQGNLDARLVNALPAAGVAITAGLLVFAVRRTRPVADAWRNSDWWRIAAAVVLLVVALPWVFASAGFYVGDVPLLGKIFMSQEFWPSGSTQRAVHLGLHHGLDGTLLAISALALGRGIGSLPAGWTRTALRWYLALMLAYGLANFANDAWLEQVVKRGWTSWQIPNMLRPELNVAWALLLAGMLVAGLTIFRPGRSVETTDVSQSTI